MKSITFQLNNWFLYTLFIFDTMKLLQNVFAFYVNSSIHVALAVVALMAITVLEFHLKIPNALWLFVFLGALTGYNFVKYAKIAGLHHRSLTNSLKTIQILSGACFVLLGVVAFQLSLRTLLVCACFGIFTFLYAVPLVKNKNLRGFAGIKIFVVAVVWAGVSVAMPVSAAEIPLSVAVGITFFQRILIVVVLLLPFEIRDVPYDSLNLKTLPQQIGVRNTKVLGIGILMLCLGLELLKSNFEKAHLFSMLFFSAATGWLIVISKTEQSRYFASFWVEGLPLLWLMAFVLFEMF